MKKFKVQVIITIILLTSSSERIFNPSRYTGVVDLLRRKNDAIKKIVGFGGENIIAKILHRK